MTITEIVDFGALVTAASPILVGAITAAAGLGAAVMVCKIAWGFAKKFIKG